jgi:hypothetical protein
VEPEEPEGSWGGWPMLIFPDDSYQIAVDEFHSLRYTFAKTRSLEVHLSPKSNAWRNDFSKFLYEWLPSIFPRVEKVTLTYPRLYSRDGQDFWGYYYDANETQAAIDYLEHRLHEFSSVVRKTSGETTGEVEFWKRPKVEIVITDIEKA